MIAPLGRILILASLLVATSGAMVAFAAGRTRSRAGLRWAQRLAYAFAALMLAATALMEYALITHDFSVSYVAHVGSRSVPLWVTIASLWSSLEGSILFWGFILGIYVAVATFLTRKTYEDYMPDAIGVWLACSAFFSFLIAGPANPFMTVLNPAMDGPGPNPLLQNHVLMVAHPPFLYLGYVGMTIPFGLACAALIRGRLSKNFLKPMREALLFPWIFQTIAIMLGGWWAYEVLGWGGYWAWDPVENASLLPWLTATAALHSMIVVERRGMLKGWTVTLVLSTFILVVLGTFMTRSGVFNSVHSFTQSAIGPTILGFLGALLVFSIALLSMRIDLLESEGAIDAPVSREGMFLVNNLLFVLFTFIVLIGTVFPLVVEAINGKQMSVGRPYFDSMVVPIGVALLFLLGVGPALPWGGSTRRQLRGSLLPPIIGGMVLLAGGWLFGARNVWTLLSLAFGGYALQVAITAFKRTPRRFASYLVHAAVVVAIIAIAVSTTMRTQSEAILMKDQSTTLAGYTVTLLGVEQRNEPHRQSTVARFAVIKDGVRKATLEPRLNQYEMMREPIGTPDVYTTASGDLYLSVLDIDMARQTVSVHVIQSPLIVWVWISVILMGIGGLFAVIPAALRRPIASPVPKQLEAV